MPSDPTQENVHWRETIFLNKDLETRLDDALTAIIGKAPIDFTVAESSP